MEFHRSALQVRTREQLPQYWATTENNMGAVLQVLGARSEGEQATSYLAQSVTAYRNALQVRTEAIFPAQWFRTMKGLAHVYEAKKDWVNARNTYQEMLRHNPGNATLSAKIKELENKELESKGSQ
jgi:hypothetical protein